MDRGRESSKQDQERVSSEEDKNLRHDITDAKKRVFQTYGTVDNEEVSFGLGDLGDLERNNFIKWWRRTEARLVWIE